MERNDKMQFLPGNTEGVKFAKGDGRQAERELGGQRFAEKCARERSMREWAAVIGQMDAKVVNPSGELVEGATLDADVVMQQYRQAHGGSTKAAAFLANLKGEMVEKVQHEGAPVIIVRSEEEARKLEDIGNIGA